MFLCAGGACGCSGLRWPSRHTGRCMSTGITMSCRQGGDVHVCMYGESVGGNKPRGHAHRHECSLHAKQAQGEERGAQHRSTGPRSTETMSLCRTAFRLEHNKKLGRRVGALRLCSSTERAWRHRPTLACPAGAPRSRCHARVGACHT
jgi:hypothetical protein